MQFWEVLVRILVATFCGGVIGIERGKKNRPAGFRTHILVCVGATMAMCISRYCVDVLGITTDVSRLGAQVIAGMGFIGAALAIGLSAIGAGIALAGGAPAAIGAIAENPKSFGKAMIFVVLGEAVALYGLVVAMLIVFLKIPDLSSFVG